MPGTVFVGWSDASLCLLPSRIVWRLSCSLEPTTFLWTFLTTRPSLMLNGLGFVFAVIHFYFAFTVFLLFAIPFIFLRFKCRRPYFVGPLYKILSIDWLMDWNVGFCRYREVNWECLVQCVSVRMCPLCEWIVAVGDVSTAKPLVGWRGEWESVDLVAAAALWYVAL